MIARRRYNAGLVLLDGGKSVQRDLYGPVSQGKPMYLRLVRRGETITAFSSMNGEVWQDDDADLRTDCAEKDKSGGGGKLGWRWVFKAEFDHFKLTRLGGTSK